MAEPSCDAYELLAVSTICHAGVHVKPWTRHASGILGAMFAILVPHPAPCAELVCRYDPRSVAANVGLALWLVSVVRFGPLYHVCAIHVSSDQVRPVVPTCATGVPQSEARASAVPKASGTHQQDGRSLIGPVLVAGKPAWQLRGPGVWHTRLLVAVGAADTTWVGVLHVVSAAHWRSVVLVGATVWY